MQTHHKQTNTEHKNHGIYAKHFEEFTIAVAPPVSALVSLAKFKLTHLPG